MKRNLFLSLLLMVVLASCNPIVVTDIVKIYPPIVVPDSVIVYGVGQRVPTSARTIGRVSVGKGSIAAKCTYSDVIRLAKTEVAKAGGNGLMITSHSMPSSGGGNCHQIAGSILRLGEGAMKNDSLVSEVFKNQAAEQHELMQRYSVPRNIFSVDMGHGHIYSGIYNGESGSSFASIPQRNGMEWRLQYEHTFNCGAGIGLLYSGFRSSGWVFGVKETFHENYFAPVLSWRWRFAEKWMLKPEFGIGYYRHDDNASNGYHLWADGSAVNLDLGLEYMVTPHIGLGASAGVLSSYLGDLKDNRGNTYSAMYDNNGMARYTFLIGFRYYF
ncbi:hypothetical protein [uncultured Bacteroides sp.]|uniref:hypothetical protein n=1 Tax=uncultured Bacteroides sp. TaxID=162156 RepID=UPI002AA7AF34|nr:hypothetical protein [uncultured Bacteroides sp.]